jgi:hypothetical protein
MPVCECHATCMMQALHGVLHSIFVWHGGVCAVLLMIEGIIDNHQQVYNNLRVWCSARDQYSYSKEGKFGWQL